MKTQVFTSHSITDIEEGIEQFRQAGNQPSLAIVFASIAHSFEQVQQVFKQYKISVFGSSSSGEIADSESHEKAIVFMLLDISSQKFQTKLFDGEGRSSYQLGKTVGGWAIGAFKQPIIFLASAGMKADGEQIVHGVIDTVGYEVPLFGGLAGDDTRFQETYVFDSERLSNLGATALVLDGERIEVTGKALSGWRGVGIPKTITRSEGNVVYEINGESALDVYARYLDIPMDSSDTAYITLEHPLVLSRADGSLTLRAPMGINEDKSIFYAGSVPQGSKVRFSIPPDVQVVKSVLEDLQGLKQTNTAPEIVILFSCIARHMCLGPLIKEEISSIYQLWDVPMIGFFTYGEIGPNEFGHCDLHNDTLSIVLLREK